MGIKAYPSFEMIPFLLLENAIKYTKENEKIKVFFSSNGDKVFVRIQSKGPYCSPEDLTHITEKGFRGEQAQRTADGNGIGLFFVKKLCDIHSVGIYFSSDSSVEKSPSGILYSDFTVSLEFNNVFDMSDYD